MPSGVYHRVRRPIAERFWEKIDIGEPDDCWNWKVSLFTKGYGKFGMRIAGRNRIMRAHRVAWLLTYGHIPDGMQILHHCDKPPCCNPIHLWMGTNADNHADKIRKGRAAIGERHPQAKLNDAMVLEMRAAPLSVTNPELAMRYGVTRITVWQARTGKTWKHV